MINRLKYQIVIRWSEQDHCFLIGFPDFSGKRWRTHGETYEEAVSQGIEALESLLIAYAASGRTFAKTQNNLYDRLIQEAFEALNFVSQLNCLLNFY